jgi:endonuclease YncB( thermonuclease family)
MQERMNARRASMLAARALATAVMLASLPLAAAEVHGKARILDGDTLEVGGQRFRLYGIGAPELGQICHRADREYACGKVARAVLWALVGGREVSCAPVSVARDDATAAICTADNTSLNQGMVAAGWALADPPGVVPYAQLQRVAKAARRGLWTGDFDPFDARRRKPE